MCLKSKMTLSRESDQMQMTLYLMIQLYQINNNHKSVPKIGFTNIASHK